MRHPRYSLTGSAITQLMTPPSLCPFIFNNHLYFHRHRGKMNIILLFSATSWQIKKLTFFLAVMAFTDPVM
jgi:hypothetical protein